MARREFRLPDLGEGLEDAEVVRWLVSLGDTVTLNQPLVEVDTAKALVEIPSPFAGTVAELHAGGGDVVKVGAPLVTFEVEGAEEEPEGKRTAVLVGYGVEEGAKPARRRRLGARISAPAAEGPAGKVLAAPPVRRIAAELGVDLATVSGSGPGGRITREDVVAAGSLVRPAAPGAEERIAVRGVRRLVAEKMARSAAEIPHVTTFLSVDMTEALGVRDEAQGHAPDVKVTPLAVVARAFVETCKAHPQLNASWDAASGEIVLRRSYHLGVATDTERGLIVPVVRDADHKDVASMAREIARLSSAAREGTATPEELTGGTVTISNVGSFGAEYGTPIINPPESSILALGVIEHRPVVREGEIVVRPVATMSLSFDHRILDGAEAGRALLDLKRLLEDPERVRSL